MKKINITCKAKDFLAYTKVQEFQGDVKTHNEKEVEHIITSILQNGFSFPIFIWKYGKVNNCLDGHGRLMALRELENRGYTIPSIPVVYIEADNEQEARRKLVEVNNLNGDFVESIFSELVTDLDLDLLDYNIPGIELEKVDARLRAAMETVDNIEGETETPVEMVKIVCPECQYEFEVEV